MIDVYQAATQMTDESGQTLPVHRQHAARQRLGALGYYGAFGANMHTDSDTEPEDDAALASAQAHTNNSLDPNSPSSVPIVSARQMLTWLDGRNASTFGNVAYSARRAELHGDRRGGGDRTDRDGPDGVGGRLAEPRSRSTAAR